MAEKDARVERIQRYSDLIARQTGKAVRPYRADGYVNLMNRYGTQKDTAEHYFFAPDIIVPDEQLTLIYEENGLFAKIIDTPAEEAIKHGFELAGVSDEGLKEFYTEALDELDWEQVAETGIKWARLFGGAIGVMLINDGRGIDEPVDWKNIESIDDIRVYERAIVQPDYASMFQYEPEDPFRTRGSRLGRPEYYFVTSKYGSFTVHESRCLEFMNGVLPENVTNSIYEFWGVPEYMRLKRALRDAEISHGSASKMLDKAVQPIYKMKDLSLELAAEDGEDRVLRRMQVVDTARGMLNTMVIDSEGEDYDFRTFSFNGVSETIDAACNLLSALTSIPQTILFGRSPAGMSATGHSDFEAYYNYVERIQKRMMKSNLRYLLSILFQAGKTTGEVGDVPKIKIQFNPLWSLSELEQAQLDQTKAATQLTKAQVASTYAQMQVLDPEEIRKRLAKEDEFEIEDIIDETDIYDDELREEYEAVMGIQQGGNPMGGNPMGGDPAQGAMGGGMPQQVAGQAQSGETPDPTAMMAMMQNGADALPEAQETSEQETGDAPDAAPTATKLPQDMSEEEKENAGDDEEHKDEDIPDDRFVAKRIGNYKSPETEEDDTPNRKIGSVGVIGLKDGAVLCGVRKAGAGKNLIGGPGGHVELGETPREAAFRETEEEFGIRPKDLVLIGYGVEGEDNGLKPAIFLCTEWDGEPTVGDGEMSEPMWLYPSLIEDLKPALFKPFADGIRVLNQASETMTGNVDKEAYSNPKETVALSEKPYNPAIEPVYPNKQKQSAIGRLRDFILSFRREPEVIDIRQERDNILTHADEFVEEDHPRNEEGEFTSKGGESKTNGEKPDGDDTEYYDPQDPPRMFGRDHLHKKYWNHVIMSGIKSGLFSKSINEAAQRKHRMGAAEFEEAKKNGLSKSVLTVSDKKVKKLAGMYRGKGDAWALDGVPREDFRHTEKIGYYVSSDGKTVIPTDSGTIHYSKDGVHIVPCPPSDEFYDEWKRGNVS